MEVSGKRERPLQFQAGQILRLKAGGLRVLESRIRQATAPTGPSRTFSPGCARRARIRDFLAPPLGGHGRAEEVRDLQAFVGGERRSLRFHDSAFERLLNRRRRHGLQDRDLWNSPHRSGGGVVTGGAMLLKKLRGIRIVGGPHRSGRDQQQIESFHRGPAFAWLAHERSIHQALRIRTGYFAAFSAAFFSSARAPPSTPVMA